MGVQSQFDTYQDIGGAVRTMRRTVQKNPESIPMSPPPSDFGLAAWTTDTLDLTSVTQAIVSGTLYAVQFTLQATTPVAKVGLLLGTTAAVTAGTYSGLAVYTYDTTTLAKLADTGATDSAKWVTAGASGYVEDSLTAVQSLAPGKYYGAFIAAFSGTMPTVASSPLPAPVITIRSTSIKRVLTLAAQTSFPATLTVVSMSAGSFVPLFGIASS
jgi:hypothetical protein